MQLLPLLILALFLPACGPDEAPAVEVPSWAHVAPEQIAEAKKHGVPVAFENDLGMRFVLVPAGTFLMGSPEGEEGRYADEKQHEVTIPRPFYMQITEVTNEQYRAGAQKQGEGFLHDGTAKPVRNLSWERAVRYARWLSESSGRRAYRLPTEEEWEYACRAGTTTPFSTGETISIAGATFERRFPAHPPVDHSLSPTTDVGSFPPNGWGLHDMHGNAWEWCLDLASYPGEDSHLTAEGAPYAAIRGGCWDSHAASVRSAQRGRFRVDSYDVTLGFRLVSPLPEPGA